MALDLHSVAKALAGEVAGRNRVLAPGPGHSGHDRSMSVVLEDGVPDGFLVTSFAGDDWRECRDHVRERLGLRFDPRQRADRPAPVHIAPTDDAGRTARALAIWHEARPAHGTPVARYLARRGLMDPPGFTTALRWHPECPFGRDRSGAMVALVRDIATDAPKAIHRTALDAAGNKRADIGANGRMTLGPIGGGAVKLTADEDVTACLGVGEGIESTLSLRCLPEFGLSPVWALLAANQLAAFPRLGGVESLWIAVDNDPTGISAAGALAARWDDGEVFRVCPARERADLNDVAQEAAHAA